MHLFCIYWASISRRTARKMYKMWKIPKTIRCVEQSPWLTDYCLFWNPRTQFNVHKRLQLDPVLDQIIPVQHIQIKIFYDPLEHWPPNLPSSVTSHNPLGTSYRSCVCYIWHASHFLWLIYPIYDLISWTLQCWCFLLCFVSNNFRFPDFMLIEDFRHADHPVADPGGRAV